MKGRLAPSIEMESWQSLADCIGLELQYHNNPKFNMDTQSTQLKGALTEQRCFIKCIEMGYTVSKPIFDNARYDFILDTGKNLLRIQVKTSHWKDEEHSAFIFNCYSQHAMSSGNKVMKYTNKEIDFFMTEQDGVFYLYPAPEVGLKEKTIRVLPPKSGQTKNISFAQDYIFEEVIKDY